MRVKVIRWTDPASSSVFLRVERWCDGQWEFVPAGSSTTYLNGMFSLDKSEQAHEFAMKLSLSKRDPVEMAVFEDGQKLKKFDPVTEAARHLFVPDKPSEG
jgi:hypothetical protein